MLPVEMSWSDTTFARSTGMAKPSPTLPPVEPSDAMVAMADGTPINSPEQSVRAPPLLPGLMAASVWTAETRSAFLPFSPAT